MSCWAVLVLRKSVMLPNDFDLRCLINFYLFIYILIKWDSFRLKSMQKYILFMAKQEVSLERLSALIISRN